MWARKIKSVVGISKFSIFQTRFSQPTKRINWDVPMYFSAMKKKASDINFEEEMASFLEREGVEFDKKEFYKTAAELKESEEDIENTEVSETESSKKPKKKVRAKSKSSCKFSLSILEKKAIKIRE